MNFTDRFRTLAEIYKIYATKYKVNTIPIENGKATYGNSVICVV